MKTEQAANTLNGANLSTKLLSLGWTSFFQNQLGGNFTQQQSARIIGVRKNMFLVKQGQEEKTATLAGKLFTNRETTIPVVGDWVLLRDSVITAILMRKNTLLRKASGSRTRKRIEMQSAEQVIAANLDMVFIVCGLDRDFNPRRIERYLTLVYNCAVSPVIILTKSDLCPNPAQFVADMEAITFGVPIYPVSLYDNTSLDEIASLLRPHKTAALVGSSGAGKSTLINRLIGEEVRTTGKVGARVGKGKHTTTTRDMISLPKGGMIIDNPGIREIGIAGESESSLETFPDIESLGRLCRFKNCRHSHEPGCRVLRAVSAGEIPADRLTSYHKLRNELSYAHQRQSKSASRIEKERWKGVSQKAKSIKKRREEYR